MSTYAKTWLAAGIVLVILAAILVLLFNAGLEAVQP